ncbi:MAG: uroporphyrinogen-III C-methyltransferase [Proteobacteria bacterium]|nr:uroporphyrinogen-III C-methyltransferase [Pseudomonadota bacterium]
MTQNAENSDNLPNENVPREPKIQTSSLAKNGIIYLSLLVALLIAGLFFYLANVKNNLENQIKTQNLNLEANTHQIEALQDANIKARKIIENISLSLDKALEQKQTLNNDWLLSKARYYIELAAINLYWTDDIKTSIALLKEADKLLSNETNSQVFQIREVLAKEINELELANSLDIPGILSEIDALKTNLAKGSFKFKQLGQPDNYVVESEQNNSSWQNNLKNSLKSLEKLIVIKHNSNQLEPYLSPLEQNLLLESINLNLQLAEIALLQANQERFKSALNEAIKEIDESNLSKFLYLEYENKKQVNIYSAPAPIYIERVEFKKVFEL